LEERAAESAREIFGGPATGNPEKLCELHEKIGGLTVGRIL
jgi:hypothetical protein